MPERDLGDVVNASNVQGVALAPDGERVEGIRVSLVAKSFWGWDETGQDGTFEIRLPEGSSGPSILSIHAGGAGGCGWLGYYGPDMITTERVKATRLNEGGGDVNGIEIRLSGNWGDPCLGQRKVSGVVLGQDGRPVEGIWLGSSDYPVWLRSGVDGTFEFTIAKGWLGLSVVLSIHANEVPAFPDCGMVGYYGPGGFTTQREEATRVEVGNADVTGIEVRLPASPDDLCNQQE